MSAAGRLLDLTRAAHFTASSARTLKAAAATAEAEQPGSVWRAAAEMRDPALALVAAATAATERRDEISALALRTGAADRFWALSEAAPMLARIDAAWALQLLRSASLPERSLLLDWKDLEFHAAVRLEPGPDWDPELVSDLAALRTARAVISGAVGSLGHSELAPLVDDARAKQLSFNQAACYLVAAAHIDPGWTLDRIEYLKTEHSATDLDPVVRLVAQKAVDAGLQPRLVELAEHENFVGEQAHWALAAAAHGFGGARLLDLVRVLVARAECEYPAEETVPCGIALFTALAHAGELDELESLALHWQIAPPLLIDELEANRVHRGAGMLANSGVLRKLLDGDEERWEWQGLADPFWWQTVARADRLAACQDVLSLVARPPWTAEPGTLADLLGLAD